MKSEREAFKAWVLKHPDNLNITSYEESIMFDAWQASAQREGCRLVPVETLEESLDWASVAKWDSPNNARDEEINKHEEVIRALIGTSE